MELFPIPAHVTAEFCFDDAVETVGREWAVLTWNIQGSKSTDLARVADVIAAESPDVVALQEVRRPQAADLADRLSMSSVWNEKHHPWRPLFPSKAEGAALLSPHTLSDTNHAAVSDVSSRRNYRRRILQRALVERADGSAYRVFNLHLSPHDMHEARRNEATRISAIARSLSDSPPTIIAGDLNDHGSSEMITLLPGIEAIAPPPTNPSHAPTDCIDHVLVPPAASAVSVSVPAGGTEWAELSDHLPLTVRFTLDWVQVGSGS